MEIYKSKYKTTTLNANKSLIINRWTNEQMDDQAFQDEILVWAEAVEEHNPKFLMANTQQFNYVVTVELQEWTNNVIFPRLAAAGVEKFAVILNPDVLTQLALEQTMEEDSSGKFQSQFFGSEEEGLAWMLG